jgi:protein-S-isoprenylcysteine O-methyltransferase Ste14
LSATWKNFRTIKPLAVYSPTYVVSEDQGPMHAPPPPQSSEGKTRRRLVAAHLLQTIVMFLIIGITLFTSAGRWDWMEAWAFLILYFLIALVTALWMMSTNPELVQERDRPGQNAKSWDNLLVGLNLLLTLSLFAVVGLDAGRYGSSEMPLSLSVMGLLGFVPAFGLPLWASKVNAFLSSRVRIQQERGHVVVAEGPYRFIRHPMYAGMVFYSLSVPLVLGSWWGLVPGGAMITVTIIRTALEDRTLRHELTGYETYCKQVRYRLIPGIW